MFHRLTLLALSVVLVGCGAAPLTGPPVKRTLESKSAHFKMVVPGIEREGDVQFDGLRARIVEHGPYGYREYRYLGSAWFQIGGEINAYGEDLAGKWVRHPRRGATDDVLAEILQAVERDPHTKLDGRGRIERVRLPKGWLELSHYGVHVKVDRPPADQLYVGHD